MREANFEGLTAAEEQRVGRGGAWRDEVARDVAWRSQRGLLSRCEGCRRQAGRQAEHVACGGGGFERVRLKQRNIHSCFFLLSSRRPTPPINLTDRLAPPLSYPSGFTPAAPSAAATARPARPLRQAPLHSCALDQFGEVWCPQTAAGACIYRPLRRFWRGWGGGGRCMSHSTEAC